MEGQPSHISTIAVPETQPFFVLPWPVSAMGPELAAAPQLRSSCVTS